MADIFFLLYTKLVNQKDVDKYVSFLIKEMALRCREANGEPIKTVYFGGGTPSVLQIFQLQQIIDSAKNCFSFENAFSHHFCLLSYK